MTATSKLGFPCRVSLEDAEVGEAVLPVNYEHQSADTPFRSSHAVFVRLGALQAQSAPGEAPQLSRTRVLSLRAFDRSGMLIDADLAEGRDVEVLIDRLLAQPQIDYIHAHYAKAVCYVARIDQA